MLYTLSRQETRIASEFYCISGHLSSDGLDNLNLVSLMKRYGAKLLLCTVEKMHQSIVQNIPSIFFYRQLTFDFVIILFLCVCLGAYSI